MRREVILVNVYIIALIGVIAILTVGYLTYGLVFKSALSGNEAPHTTTHLVGSIIGMYIIALIFTVLYKDVIFYSGITGVMKGLYLGLMVGLAGFALPLMIDGAYLKANAQHLRVLTTNWLAAFILLGIVVGLIVN